MIQLITLLLLNRQKRFNFGGGLHRPAERRVPALDHTVPGHDPLGEVPFDAVGDETGPSHLQVGEQRVGGGAVDVDFGEQVELGGHLVAGELFHFGVRQRFPATELVAGETEDGEPCW